MKVLALADIHGKFFRLDGIVKKSDPVDAVVIAGDLTHGGPPENAVRSISILKHFCPRVLGVPGNWDTPEVAEPSAPTLSTWTRRQRSSWDGSSWAWAIRLPRAITRPER